MEVISTTVEPDAIIEPDKTPDLTSELFAAVINIAEQLVGEENHINQISLKDCTYFFTKRNDFHYILQTDLANANYSEADILKLLNQISVIFEVYFRKKNDGHDSEMLNAEDGFKRSITLLISTNLKCKIFTKMNSI